MGIVYESLATYFSPCVYPLLVNVPACVYLSVCMSLHVHSLPYVYPFRIYNLSYACPVRVCPTVFMFLRVYNRPL